jgi:hypothetical protein
MEAAQQRAKMPKAKSDISTNLIRVFQTPEECTMIRKRGDPNLNKRARRVMATATAFTFLCQNFAWAVCADGSTFPAGGFVGSQPPVTIWSPNTFTDTLGSIFVPDNSVFEHNDPGQPVTGGGHNWAFDQGSTLCKETDTGPAGGTPTAWAIPSNTTADCIVLPVIKLVGGQPVFGNLAVIPLPGQTITPACNPALLSQPGAPNPANTRLNQLGCAISHGVATTPQSATTYLFVAGMKSGLWAASLADVANPVSGGDAGKIVAGLSYYSTIPLGQTLNTAAVSLDGMFAIATSIARTTPPIFACLNPLGDPGDPSVPINPNFAIPPPNQVKCMSIGSGAASASAFGPDNKPYFAMGTLRTFTAWPQCAQSVNGCGTPKTVINLPTQTLISHGSYLYIGGTGSPVTQIKVTVDPVTGSSHYAFRTYFSGGTGFTTGLGVADDLNSFMAFTDPSGLGLAGQEAIFKMPLCEDM